MAGRSILRDGAAGGKTPDIVNEPLSARAEIYSSRRGAASCVCSRAVIESIPLG